MHFQTLQNYTYSNITYSNINRFISYKQKKVSKSISRYIYISCRHFIKCLFIKKFGKIISFVSLQDYRIKTMWSWLSSQNGDVFDVNKRCSLEKHNFYTNSKQTLPFRLVFCYLASGTYDTPNSFGNNGIQTQYVVLMQSSPTLLHNALQNIGVFNLDLRFYFIVFITFSIILRSGLWAGHGKVPKVWSHFHSFALADTWQAAFSSW